MDDRAFSKDEERRLLELFQESALHDFPNPERKGCPGDAFLRQLALDRKSIDWSDPRWEHVTKCSPCFQELKALRDRAAGARVRNWIAAAAVLILIGGGVWVASRVLRRSDTHPIQASLDLKNWTILRGSDDTDGPKNAPQILPRGRVSLTVILPLASPPGPYELELCQDVNRPLRATGGIAYVASRQTKLPVELDTSNLKNGLYLLRIRRPTQDWAYFPVGVQGTE